MNKISFNSKFLEKLSNARSLVFFTGAGISAESGIATFRGKDGLWNKLKPEELANFDAFMANPEMVWEWYNYRRNIVNETGPNNAHKAIKELEEYYNSVTVVTQNVDNLHTRAGSKHIYELHGNIERNYCIECNTFLADKEIKMKEKIPSCSLCGGLVRPDVVWFGEFLPEDQFNGGRNAAESCDICFVVGTSAVVYPAAHIPISAKRNGAYLVEVNIEETDLSYQTDISFFGKAGEILPAIVKKVKELKM